MKARCVCGWGGRVLSLALVGGALVLASSAAGEDVIDVGNRKQLFVDETFIEHSENIALTMNPPWQTGEVLLDADQPHEEGGYVSLYSSVLKGEDSIIRLWYDLITPYGPDPYDHHRRVCYAESEDGLHFTKPELGLHEVDGSTANNVVLPGVIGGCSVWLDPKAPPEHRFKTQAKSYHPTRFPMHSSPDGRHWQLFAEPALSGPTDTQTIIFWDPARERYVMYTREWVRSDTERYRAVRRLESDDLQQWDSESVVFDPDETDRATYDTPDISPPVDYYGATVFKYPLAEQDEAAAPDDRVYIMLAQAFWHFTDKGYDGVIGPFVRDVRLAVSRDGKTFHRAGGRNPFLRPGPAGSFDSKGVWALPHPIQMGDELWIYYVGTNQDRTSRPTDSRIDPEAPDGDRLGGISRAVMRLDGFVSADAPYDGGEFVTPLIRFAGGRLELNVDTGGGGSVLVELLDSAGDPIEGFTIEDAIPVNGNSVRMPVQWGGDGDVGQLAGTPVRLRFVMRDCKLYAFQFCE